MYHLLYFINEKYKRLLNTGKNEERRISSRNENRTLSTQQRNLGNMRKSYGLSILWRRSSFPYGRKVLYSVVGNCWWHSKSWFSVPRSLCVNCWLLVNDWSLGLGMHLILWISCNVSKSDNCNKQN